MVFSSWLVISGMLPVMSVLVVNVMSEGVTVTEPIRKKARKVNVFREKVASLLENVAFDLNDFGIEGRERMFARSERYRLCGQWCIVFLCMRCGCVRLSRGLFGDGDFRQLFVDVVTAKVRFARAYAIQLGGLYHGRGLLNPLCDKCGNRMVTELERSDVLDSVIARFRGGVGSGLPDQVRFFESWSIRSDSQQVG